MEIKQITSKLISFPNYSASQDVASIEIRAGGINYETTDYRETAICYNLITANITELHMSRCSQKATQLAHNRIL